MPEVKILRLKSALITSILTLLACASLVSAQSTAAAKPATAPPAAAQPLADRNRAVALRVFEEIFNQRRPEVAAEIYSPYFRHHGIDHDDSLAIDQGWAPGDLWALPAPVTTRCIFRRSLSLKRYGVLPPTGTVVEGGDFTIILNVDGWCEIKWV